MAARGAQVPDRSDPRANGLAQRLRGRTLWSGAGPLEGLRERLQTRGRAMREAEANVTRSLEAFREPLPAAPEAATSAMDARVSRYLEAMNAFDDARTAQLERRDLLPGQGARRRATLGVPNLDVVREAAALEPGQRAALGRLLTLFQDAGRLELSPGTLGEGVQPTSPRMLMALTGAIRSPYASLDRSGAANIDHLGSVFRGVLEREAARLERPLTQAEANRLALETVLTDAWFKGRGLEELLQAPTAPTEAGSTVAEVDRSIKARVKASFEVPHEGSAALSEPVLKVMHGWVDRGHVPMDPDGVRADGEAAGLSPGELRALEGAWRERILEGGDWKIIEGFMRGVMLHGLPAYELVEHVVRSAGEGVDPREVYFAIVGHHMAGFIASGLGRAQLKVCFTEMERLGHLPPGAGQQLEDLYDRAMGLAVTWRPRIDAATLEGRGLSKPERERFREEAAPLREAIAALPEYVRSQLYNDDTGQFLPQAIEKWIAMQSASTNGGVLAGVYQSAQAYYEESLARDLEDPGQAFRERTELAATRLGVVRDEATDAYRPARPGELAHELLALELSLDGPTRQAFLAAQGLPPDTSPAALREPAWKDALVAWFRDAPRDPALLVRLAHPEDGGAR